MVQRRVKHRLLETNTPKRKHGEWNLGGKHVCIWQLPPSESKNGGGTRHCTVNKNSGMSALLWCAIDMFFPHGPAEDFEFILQDFAGRLLSMDKTISDIYKETYVKMLRVYFCSHPKMSHQDMLSATQDTCETMTETVCMQQCCGMFCHMQS